MKNAFKLGISLCLLSVGFFLSGCGVLPLRPGRAVIATETGKVISVHQSQNPLNETTQDYRLVTDPETKVITEEVHTKIGAAQKDTAREMAAKLGALKGVVWIGVLVFLFGAASFAYPPLKVIVGGSTTTSAVISASGLAMIILPTLIVGHELLILCVAAGAAALYFFAHRHGSVHSELKTLKSTLEGK
jgi:hypothetical protein